MSLPRRIAAIPAIIAACGMTAGPLAAAELATPTAHEFAPASPVWDKASQTAQHRRHGWGRSWHRNRDRVDAGDVLAGVLIIGGIAAIADAVKRDRDRDVRYPDDYRYRERPAADGWGDYRDRSGLENAAAICADEVEREAPVAGIDGVDRTAAGWEVRGTLSDGAAFICRIGPNGRVADVDYSLRRDRPVYDGRADDRRDDYFRD